MYKRQDIKEKILYVDDEQENLEVFGFTFRKYYDIYLANTAEKGMEILNKETIKLVITDQRMPHITGVEFLANVADLDPRIIPMITTGFSDIETITQAINKGRVYRYIIKPWNSDELKIAIDNALEAYNLKDENQKLIKNLQKANAQLKETNKILKQAKETAEQSDNLKSSFLANMSHEIRTPLNSILGFSNLLTFPDLNDAQKNKFVSLIKENGKYLLGIIDDIIDISKIESNQMKLKPISFSVNELIKELCSFFYNDRNLLQKTNVSLTAKIMKAENISLFTDRDHLKQILFNFISNAIKFTDKGTISIGYTVKDSEIVFYTKDEGIGIPKNKFKYIFERFKKIEYEKKVYRGNGLGLTISQNLAKLIKGEIHLVSQINKGSTFYFSLPYSPNSTNQNTQKKEEMTYNWENKTILVADDDELSNNLLAILLEKTKAKILTANDGAEAYDLFLKNQQIDLALLDIQMPKKNGYELIELFKSQRPQVKIIVQTAFALPDDRKKSMDKGADNYLAKPLDYDELFRMIDLYFQ